MRNSRGMQTVSPNPPTSVKNCSTPHLWHEGETVSNLESAQAHLPAASSGAPLLTPSDILSRLSLTSAKPTKWMRRIFGKHHVPYVHVCGQIRATEAQYRLLMERITCSPCGAVERSTSTTSKRRLEEASSTSTSRNSVQERVTQMLRRTKDQS